MRPFIVQAVVSGAAAAFLLAGALAGCAGSSALSPLSGASATTTQIPPARTPATDTWRRSVSRVPLPSAGCFEATYPALAWARVACTTPPPIMLPPHITQGSANTKSRVNAAIAGGGSDYTIQTGSNLISTAVGSFPVASTSTVTDTVGSCALNCFSLQLNSGFFPTAACNGQPNCLGWEQFVFESPTWNVPEESTGYLFIEDWLLNYSPCPSGWNSYEGVDCWKNSDLSSSVAFFLVDLTTLESVVETGAAASSGDSLYLTVGTKAYGYKNVQSDGITDLASHWNAAQFNILGSSGGATLDFNGASTIEVSLQADDGVLTAPTCQAGGYTAETNNLSLVAAPASAPELTYPSILYEESNVSGLGSPSCDAVAGQ